jgi:sulfite exporter TauE/SafE
MAFFGLGTLPALLFVGFYGNQISISLRQRISKFVPYLLTLVGLLMLLRGLNLNIPMISPGVKVKKAIEQSKPSVEVKCCYKPTK